MRKFTAILLSCLAAFPAGAFVTVAAAEPLHIRVGYPSPSASLSPLFAPKEGGLFEKYGLSAELMYLQNTRALRKYTGSQDAGISGHTYDVFSSKYIKKVPTLSLKNVDQMLAMVADRNPRAKDRKAGDFVETSLHG